MTSQETYDPFPRPGDPNFTSFPKALQDATVEYTIFRISRDQLTPAQTRARLVEIQKAAIQRSKTLFKEYIWQRESFNLTISRQETDAGGRWFLHGRTEYGDSIADEWAIVYLLRELSKVFDDAWIRVTDPDGEFLLVEAANVLPRWLEPEIASNRVWINKGEIKIIPRNLSGKSEDRKSPTKSISLQQALSFISTQPSNLIHSPTIESEAFFRLNNYPSEISKSLHTARITIPRKLAYILHRTPAHISPAVDAFFLRDPISLRPLLKEPSRLHFNPSDLVTVSVKFTRVGYAQFKSQHFPPPPSWHFTLSKTPTDPRLDLGMKVSSGFDMLLLDPANASKPSVREINLLLSDLDSGDEALPTDAEISTWPQTEDDDSWMDVNYEDFEAELSGRAKASGSSGSAAFGATSTQDNLRRIVERFEAFLNDDSAGPDGVDFDNDDEDEDDDSSISDDDDEDEGEDRAASFDEEEFANAMREMMGLPAEHNATSASALPSTTALPPHDARITELVDSINDNKAITTHLPPSSSFSDNPDDDDDDDDDELGSFDEIKRQMEAVERELREAGALDADEPSIADLLPDASTAGQDPNDPRYLLARNLLAAFRGEAGGAGGPVGNMMRSLGLSLPRDEGDDGEEEG